MKKKKKIWRMKSKTETQVMHTNCGDDSEQWICENKTQKGAKYSNQCNTQNILNRERERENVCVHAHLVTLIGKSNTFKC